MAGALTTLDSLDSLDEAAPGDQLRTLVAAWRSLPCAELAELVKVVGARVEAQRPATRAGKVADVHRAWLAAAQAGDPCEVGWLLVSVVGASADLSWQRLRAVASWPDDPRIVPALWHLVVTRPLVTQRPVWTQIFFLLRKHADASLVAAIDDLLGVQPESTFDTYRAEQLRRLRRTCAERPTPTCNPAQQARIAEIATRLGVADARRDLRTDADFLTDVWAHPDDDAPRIVYGDWLTERGDPRGELIALQVRTAAARAATIRRELALVKLHGRDWLGPLQPAVAKGALVYERGFVASCTINWHGLLATPGLVEHPAWSTVREYRLDAWADKPCDAWLDRMIARGAKRI